MNMKNNKEILMDALSSVYIHIPFCRRICSYCDFCKFYYNNDLVDKYLSSLKKELSLKYKQELIKTIYIGGGTPSCLSFKQLDKLFDIISILNISNDIEFTFECNIEDINYNLLEFLKQKNVNRLSIGLQTFNKHLLKKLNRVYDNQAIEKIKLANTYFNTNVDLIYAIPGQTLDDLKHDLDILLSLDVNHISCYSLIIEKHTKMFIDNIAPIKEELDLKMYQLICHKLKDYHHYEISNFSLNGFESKHNLVYWNNKHYYGFGLSSSGYIDNIRYDNTRSINHYLKGDYVLENNKLTINEQIENEFILGLRKINGINKNNFYNKYHISVNDIDIVKKLLNNNMLIDDGINIYIPKDKIYISNTILVNFLDIRYKK